MHLENYFLQTLVYLSTFQITCYEKYIIFPVYIDS